MAQENLRSSVSRRPHSGPVKAGCLAHGRRTDPAGDRRHLDPGPRAVAADARVGNGCSLGPWRLALLANLLPPLGPIAVCPKDASRRRGRAPPEGREARVPVVRERPTQKRRQPCGPRAPHASYPGGLNGLFGGCQPAEDRRRRRQGWASPITRRLSGCPPAARPSRPGGAGHTASRPLFLDRTKVLSRLVLTSRGDLRCLWG